MNPLTLLVAVLALTQTPQEPEDAAPPAPVVGDDDASGARLDAAAEAEYGTCQDHLSSGDVDSARKCFTRIAAGAPESEAALKSRAALFVLDARLKPPPAAEEDGNLIPPGRLGITTAAGLFGAWNGIAGGVLLGVNSKGAIPSQPLIIGTGAVAVAAGAAMGAGGYFLADHLELDEGAARLVASSLVWGTALGTALVPITTQPFREDAIGGINAGMLTVLASGYAAGGGALILATGVEFDEAQVGLINSGGMIGSFMAFMIMPNIPLYDDATGVSNGIDSGVAYGATYVISTSAGLLAGGALGRVLDMTWGEVLLCDLGGALGGVGGGALGLGIGGNDAASWTVPPAIGVLAGYGAGVAIVSLWRESRGAPILRSAPELRPVVSSVATSRTSTVPTFGLAGEF